MITLEEARRIFPPLWTIYERPLDFPGKFVVRTFYRELPTNEVSTHDTLMQAREQCVLNGGSMPIMRSPYDDPFIVETWI